MPDIDAGGRIHGLDAGVARAFYGNFKVLRPAQLAAVEPVLAGRDVVVRAGTGSGKTEAVMAPIVTRLWGTLNSAKGPVIVYVAPTRALVNDIYRRLEPPIERLGIALGVRHGEQNDLDRVDKPVVLVTTPESVDVLLWGRQEILAEVRAVVIDEAHLLFNTQRGMQMAILLRRIERLIGRPIQVIAMSATVADSAALWAFFRPGVKAVSVDDPSARDVQHQIRIGVTPADLADRLGRLAASERVKILVFADSRRECDELAAVLRERTAFGERAFAHHASLSKEMRLQTESLFLREFRAVCVATSTLELGIDIGDIDLVVLWGRALGWQSLLQRIGRGNRRSDSVNVLCAVPEDRSTRISAALGFQAFFYQVEERRCEADEPLAIFGAACQQVMSVVMANGGAYRRASDLAELLSPWAHLDGATVQLMLDELVAQDMLVPHPVKRWYGPAERAHQVVSDRLIWANFPLASREIGVFCGSQEVGRIAGQNLTKLTVGAVFALGARRYRVARLQADRIEALKSTEAATVRLSFGGIAAEVDPTLLEAEWSLLCDGGGAEVVPQAAAQQLSASLSRLHSPPATGSLLYCRARGRVWYLTFAGRALNSVMAGWFSGCGATAGEISLVTDDLLDWSRLPPSIAGFGDLLRQIDNDDRRQSIFQAMLPVELLVNERMDVWQRRPVFARTLARLRASTPREVPWPSGLDLEGE